MLTVSYLFSPMASIRGPSRRKFRKKVVKASALYARGCKTKCSTEKSSSSNFKLVTLMSIQNATAKFE